MLSHITWGKSPQSRIVLTDSHTNSYIYTMSYTCNNVHGTQGTWDIHVRGGGDKQPTVQLRGKRPTDMQNAHPFLH